MAVVGKAQTDTLQLENVLSPEGLNVPAAQDSMGSPEKDVINAAIFYEATDSAVYDALEQKVYLYGNAVVKYGDIELRSGYIAYGFADNSVYASGIPDSAGQLVQKPVFLQAGQEFKPETIRYNFKSGKGFIEDVITSQGEFYLHADETKRFPNEWVHIRKGKFTTCDAEKPHYHFHLTKAIVIPEDKVVSGPVYVRFWNIPTPLALPFGWFPNKQTSSHGILLPAYGNGGNLGYFLRDGGYYIPIGDFADTRFLADVYTRGSWTLRNISSYRKKYKYNGNFNVSRSLLKQGLEELPGFSKRTEFFVRWNHNQDPKARPNTSFSADINAGSRNNFTNNIVSNQQDYLSNTFQSNVRFTRSWAGKPYNLSVNLRHSQNSLTRNVDLTLPSVAFTVSRFYLPLSFLNTKPGAKKWYETIGVNYAMNFDNRLDVEDRELRFDNYRSLSTQFRNGIRHTLNVNTSLKAGFVSVNPSLSITDRWYFNYLRVGLDPETLQSEKDTVRGFRTAPDWNVAVNANTKVFGLFNLSKTGMLRALRHVITPTVGLSFRPDMGTEVVGYFGQGGGLSSYSPFDIGIFGKPTSSRSGSLNLSILNNLEAKVRNRKDTQSGVSKLSLIENFRAATSYDFFRDSLNFSNVTLDGFTTIFQNVNLNYSSSHSLYDRDSLGRPVNRFLAKTQNRLMRLNAANLALNFNLRSGQNRSGKKSDNVLPEEQEEIDRNSGAFVDFTIPWNLNVAYSMRMNKIFDRDIRRDTSEITQSILFNGDFTVFRKWKVGFNSGYDISAGEFTPTTLNLFWDLHCWELRFDFIPFGIRKSYAVQLNIKSSTLKDLKLQRRRNLSDGDLLL
jgi:hypothetical protein